MSNSELTVTQDDDVSSVPAEQKPGDSYVQSFARGLSVLRSFGAEAPAQTLSEVAERAQLTRAGARRILLTLLHLGYVDAEGRLFRLRPKVMELGFAYLSSLPIWTLAQPVIEELVESLRQSCSIAVLDGEEIVYVLRVPARKIMSLNLSVGSRLPAYCTSTGRVLLAGLSPAALKEHLSGISLIPRTSHTIVNKKQLLDQIEQVRGQGWCMISEELEEDLVSLAAPIFDRSGRVTAAINISGRLNNPSRENLLGIGLPKLLAAADQISQLLRSKQ
ncbi:MAG: IclR family transcriptional regulator C-terminal domain-containing protein [Betaproteobacteria bacterium]